MKKILSILFLVALTALLFVPAATAQTYGTITLTTPTIIAASTASNTTQVVDCRYNKNVAFTFGFKGANSGTDNVTFALVPSLDGLVFDTTKVIPVIAAANGLTQVYVSTNIDMGAYGWVKLSYMTNASAAVNVTNVTATAALKPGY